MGQIAYALRGDYAGTVEQDGEEVPLFSGGITSAGDAGDLDVAELLEEGGGTIVVDDRDPRIVLALDEFLALKRVPVPDDVKALVGDYDGQPVTTLRGELKRRGVTGGGNLSQDDAVTALKAYDERFTDPAVQGAEVRAAELLEPAENEEA